MTAARSDLMALAADSLEQASQTLSIMSSGYFAEAQTELSTALATDAGRCFDLVNSAIENIRLAASQPDREALASAIRTFCTSQSARSVAVSSDNIERIYYPGLPLNGLADAILSLLSKSAPPQAASHNSGERDPSVMPDCRGADTKSDGGEPMLERTQARLAGLDEGLGPMQAIPKTPSGPFPPGPSDTCPHDMGYDINLGPVGCRLHGFDLECVCQNSFKPGPSDPSPGPDVSLPPPVGEPVAFITKSGFKNWLQGDGPENHVLLRTGGDLRVALYTHPVAWECVAQRQSLPEPADCDWPVCGCDPHANKVIESLEEQGVLSTHPPAPAVGPDVREALDREEKYLLEHFDAECGIMPSDVEGSFHRIRAALTRPLGGFVQGSIADGGQCNEQSGKQPSPAWPQNLHPRTLDMVQRFAVALAKKLRLAEEKYGFGDGWADDHWEKECLAHFHSHIEKGDPLDVAAYCAFMWHHRWITYPAAVADTDADAKRDDGLLSGVSADPT